MSCRSYTIGLMSLHQLGIDMEIQNLSINVNFNFPDKKISVNVGCCIG